MAFLMFKELVVKQPIFTFFFYLNLIKIVSIERVVLYQQIAQQPDTVARIQCRDFSVQCSAESSAVMALVQYSADPNADHRIEELKKYKMVLS
jgi:hypothetical protein